MTNSGFIPEQSFEEVEVPFFDDVTAEDGWQGHATRKTLSALQSEVTQAFSRLDGLVINFIKGRYPSGRLGYRIFYAIKMPNGEQIPGRMDIAALPVREPKVDGLRGRDAMQSKEEKTLKMALYMVKAALDGARFMKQLSPGYQPLMPWMIQPGVDPETAKTLTEAFNERNGMLLSPSSSRVEKDEDSIEGEFKEVE
jgi:hypothetical protein